MNSQKIEVFQENGRHIGYTNPGRARKLIKANKAYITHRSRYSTKIKLRYNSIKEQRVSNFFTSEKNQELINISNVSRIELKNKKIMFFLTDIGSRENWEYETPEEAKTIFESIKSGPAKDLFEFDENCIINLANVVYVEQNKDKVMFFATDFSSRFNGKTASEDEAKKMIEKIISENKSFITDAGQNAINRENIGYIELKANRVMFFNVAVSARTNWEYAGEEQAAEAFDRIKKLLPIQTV